MSVIGKCKHGWALDLCKICYPRDGVWLTNIPHPEGDSVSDDLELNPDSIETIEVGIPVMPEDQLETWMHNMIRACNRSTSDSDINIIKLIQHIENLYEQGRAYEREVCAKLCEKSAYWDGYVAASCAAAIRARGEK